MKDKFLHILEQYIEFVVLAVVVVFFGIYLSQQFLGNPNAAKHPKTKVVISPEDVNTQLKIAARALQRDLDMEEFSEAMRGIEPPEASSLLERFEGAAGKTIVPDQWQSVLVASRGPIDINGIQGELARSPVHEPVIPAPRDTFVYQTYDTLTEQAASEEGIAGRFSEGPFDVTWLTVAAKLDLDEVLRRYQSPGPNRESPISERWYDGRVDVVDVVVKRREVRFDGSFGEEVEVGILPGQVSYRKELQGEPTSSTRDEVLGDLRSNLNQELLVHPEFLATKASRWESPEDANDRLLRGGDEPPEDRLRRLLARRTTLEAEIERAGGGDQGDGGSGGGGMFGGGGGMMGGGGGMGGPGGPGGPIGGGESGGGSGGDKARLLKRLERQLSRVNVDIKKIMRVMNLSEEDLKDYEEESSEEQVDAFEMKGSVWIWVHDLDVEPGKTYEYQVSAVVYNPLFAKSLSLPESQRELANDLTISSSPSPWTAPIQVQPPTLAYVGTAYAMGQGRGAAGALGLGVASIDLYHFRDGVWTQDRQSAQPGDRLGMLDPEGVNVDTGYYILDIVPDPLATDENMDIGRGALVLLGRGNSGEIVEIRSPLVDRDVIRPWIEEVEDESAAEEG